MKLALSSLLFSFILACGGPGDGGSKVDQAVTIARELRARPADAEQILAEHSLTADQWEALMFDIADDPALAAKYAAALEK